MTKCCIKCNTEKELSEFELHYQARDGHRNVCKSCNLLADKKRRHKRKEGGICSKCGKKPPVSGRVFCLECLKKSLTTWNKRAKENNKKGLCHCGAPVFLGLKICKNHSDLAKKNGKSYRRKFSEKIGNYFNNTCAICGVESKDYEIFDVHHLDPNQKKYKISHMVAKDWETEILPELEKCMYLCACCHRRLHAGRFDEAVLI